MYSKSTKVLIKVIVRTLIILIIIALQITVLLPTESHAGQWSFTQDDYNSLSDSQKVVIKQSYWIGKPHGLGITLAAISIVETRAGAFPDKSPNRICGAHQVDVVALKRYLGTKTSTIKMCRALESNPVISAIGATHVLLYWKSKSKTYKGMLNMYNRGWQRHRHDAEYLRRVLMAVRVLMLNDIEKL